MCIFSDNESLLYFQFMKFIKKIGDGDITIKDNQVVENKDGALGEAASVDKQWAQEFSEEKV